MLGTRINQFIVCRKLAEGGMGAVYIAVHERFAQLRKVVKVLRPELSRDRPTRQRFEREAEAISRLAHEHIVAIDDFGRLPDGELFLMMPYLDGEPLSDHLRRRGRLGEHRALHIIVQVCSALQHMHDAGIVHRDLKPANILITHSHRNPYEVKLIDFGIAKVAVDGDPALATGDGMAIGTPAYMAVEQFEDARRVSPHADVFAAAVITWEMLTGRLPWGLHPASVLYCRQREGRPGRPPEHQMAMQWADVLLRALALDALDRPQSARELAIALASNTAAVPPRLPSGAEILADVARDLVQHARPDMATLLNATSDDRTPPLLWPRRETAPRLGLVHVQPRAHTMLSASTIAASRSRRPHRVRLVGTVILAGVALAGVAVSVPMTHVPTAPVASPPTTYAETARGDAGVDPPCDAATTDAATFTPAPVGRSTRGPRPPTTGGQPALDPSAIGGHE